MCMFCEKLSDENTHKFDYEHFYAMYDEFPVSKGHMLIIPKRHMVNTDDLSLKEVVELHLLIQSVKTFLCQEFNAQGFNIGVNEGEVAGQTIGHLHIHVIPRYKGDVDDPRGGIRGVIPSKQSY